VYAGNIGEAHDIETIFKSILFLRDEQDINFIFIGEGSKRKWLENEINKNNLSNKVLFLGFIEHNKMPFYLRKADILIVTLKNNEIFSLTMPARIQTYLAVGRPIFTMLNGIGSEIIRDARAGFTSNAGDYIKFSENILKFKKLSNLERNKMKIRAKEYYQIHFNKYLILKKFEDIVNEIIKK